MKNTSVSASPLKLAIRFALFLAFAVMITAPSIDFSSTGEAYAQRRRRDRDRDDSEPSRQRQREEAQSPAQAQPASPSPAANAINASTPFGQALAACDAQQEETQYGLPGLKGEIKLDRCYRGRKHLACRIDVVLGEGKSLTDEYTRIVDAKYQDVTNLADICKIDLDALIKDAGGATEFAKRFASARAEYDVRTACATKVKAAIGDVTLPELVQAPEVLKSMMDAIEAEITRVSTAHKQVADLAAKVEASYKSILVLQKIHRAMCTSVKPKDADAGGGAAQQAGTMPAATTQSTGVGASTAK